MGVVGYTHPTNNKAERERERERDMGGGVGLVALHFAGLLIAFLNSVAVWGRRIGWRFVGRYEVSSSFARRPRVVAVVLESEEVQQRRHKVVELLQLLVEIGVQHVSLYDMEGAAKLVLTALEESLEKRLGEKLRIRNYYGCDLDKPDVSSSEGQRHLTVEILSHYDGKEAIVQAARFLCLKAAQTNDRSKLTEDDVNRSLRSTGGAGPDPDLLLLFSNTKSLLGFPPWRLRLTEIMHMGLIKNLTKQSFMMALHEFSKKTHRYGE